MTSTIGNEGVGIDSDIMTSTKVMTKLMTKSVIANCTTFLADGEGKSILIGTYVRRIEEKYIEPK